MKKLNWMTVAFLCTVVSVTSSTTFAQTSGKNLPGGTFAQTSTDIKLTLNCLCETMAKRKIPASLDITNTPNAHIENKDGKLVVNKDLKSTSTTFTPDGTYKETCTNIKVQLTAATRKKDNVPMRSLVNITDLPLNTEVENTDGVLTVIK